MADLVYAQDQWTKVEEFQLVGVHRLSGVGPTLKMALAEKAPPQRSFPVLKSLSVLHVDS